MCQDTGAITCGHNLSHWLRPGLAGGEQMPSCLVLRAWSLRPLSCEAPPIFLSTSVRETDCNNPSSIYFGNSTCVVSAPNVSSEIKALPFYPWFARRSGSDLLRPTWAFRCSAVQVEVLKLALSSPPYWNPNTLQNQEQFHTAWLILCSLMAPKTIGSRTFWVPKKRHAFGAGWRSATPVLRGPKPNRKKTRSAGKNTAPRECLQSLQLLMQLHSIL